MLLQALAELGGACGRRAGTIHDDEIGPGKPGRKLAERLAGLALDAIAVNGTARELARDGEPEPGRVLLPVTRAHEKQVVGQATTAAKDVLEFAALEQSLLARQRETHDGEATSRQTAGEKLASGRQALAALGAATLDHEAATLGGHAGAEAVGAFALELARLEGAFHDVRTRVRCRTGLGATRGRRPFGRAQVTEKAPEDTR